MWAPKRNKTLPSLMRLWELVLGQWRAVTGEAKVTTRHGRIVLFGDRSAVWDTEAEEAEWAGLEEPWAIVHKATLQVMCLKNGTEMPLHSRARAAPQHSCTKKSKARCNE